MNRFRCFQILVVSLWPILFSWLLGENLDSLVCYMHYGYFRMYFFGVFSLLFILFMWFFDINQESWGSDRSKSVMSIFRWSVILFIISETFLFISFFWSFYDYCFTPGIYCVTCPPLPLKDSVIDPCGLPLYNSIILLASGMSVTYVQYLIQANEYDMAHLYFVLTLFLGTLFLFIQFFEYRVCYLSINTTVFGTCFFMLTGFHGLHVCIGLAFLWVCYLRFLLGNSLSIHFNSSLEAAIWYWHFVDVVWVLLYFGVYWYGSMNGIFYDK